MKWKMKTARRLWIWANSIQHKIIVECRSGPLKPYRPNSLQSRPAWWAIAGRWSPPVIYSWRRRMCLLLGVRLQTCDDQEQQKTQNTKRLLRSLYRQYHGLASWSHIVQTFHMTSCVAGGCGWVGTTCDIQLLLLTSGSQIEKKSWDFFQEAE